MEAQPQPTPAAKKYQTQKVMLDNNLHRLLVEPREQRASMQVERGCSQKGALAADPSRRARREAAIGGLCALQ
jgi:hypothetical protein